MGFDQVAKVRRISCQPMSGMPALRQAGIRTRPRTLLGLKGVPFDVQNTKPSGPPPVDFKRFRASKATSPVLIREEKQPNEYNVVGSLEHWSWIEEDQELRQAPIDWAVRYAEKLWSR